MTNILITTTPTVENRPVREYLGIVSGEAFTFRWSLRFSSLRSFDTEKLDSVFADTVEGRSWSDFKANLHKARDWAIQQMAKAAKKLGANAVIGVKIDYKTILIHDPYDGRVSEYPAQVLIATGTAVRL
jgi:uncharacterized protein YbjQ (UPF0145 family)